MPSPPLPNFVFRGRKSMFTFKSSLETVFPLAQIEISSSRKGVHTAEQRGRQVLEGNSKVFVPVFIKREVALIQILWHRCKGLGIFLSENSSHFVFDISDLTQNCFHIINEVHNQLSDNLILQHSFDQKSSKLYHDG